MHNYELLIFSNRFYFSNWGKLNVNEANSASTNSVTTEIVLLWSFIWLIISHLLKSNLHVKSKSKYQMHVRHAFKNSR